MGFIVGFLTVVYFLTCVILVVIVLMQEPKGGGLSSAFGGSGLDTAFGASIGRKMSSFTVWLAVIFIILTFALAILGKTGSSALSGSVMQDVRKEQPPAKAEEPSQKQGEQAVPPGKPAGEQPPGKPGEAPDAEQPKAEDAPKAPAEQKQPPKESNTQPVPEPKPGSGDEPPAAPDKDE